jgi:hypothetical protein
MAHHREHATSSAALAWALAALVFAAGLGTAVAQQRVVRAARTVQVDGVLETKSDGEPQGVLRGIATSDGSVAVAREHGTNDVLITARRPGTAVITYEKSLDDGKTWTKYVITVTVKRRNRPPRPVAPNPPPGPPPQPPKPPATEEENYAILDDEPPAPKPPAPGAKMDPCLVGTWEATTVTYLPGQLTGGTGFRVTFKADGTEVVDYSGMAPLRGGNDTITYTGTATGHISTADNVAKVESVDKAGVTESTVSVASFTLKLPGLGPGALGSATTGAYTCSGDTLEYKTSAARDRHATFAVKLKRVKP